MYVARYVIVIIGHCYIITYKRFMFMQMMNASHSIHYMPNIPSINRSGMLGMSEIPVRTNEFLLRNWHGLECENVVDAFLK